MKIALFQTDIAWNRPEANLQKLREWMRYCEAGTNLVVVPEMFSTGFAVSPPVVAESMDGLTVTALLKESARTGIAIAGSFALRDRTPAGAALFNRFLLVTPEGRIRTYDKRHLFRMGREREIYRGGNVRKVFEYGGWRFCPQVCYDLRFPVWSRNRGDYDVLIYVANWPASRREAWKVLLRARAIENQCYVIGCNRVGCDPATAYGGDSAILDFKGNVLAEAISGGEEVLSAELDAEALRAFREKFPAWLDADDFEIRE